MGRDPFENLGFNFLFVGPPGTGKTTIAHRMGMLFESLGVLDSSEVVSKSATDFQTGYVGQAGKKTRQIFEEALGRVLIIDEAYRLNPSSTIGSYMQEVIDEIVQMLTEPQFKNKMVVILAGYEEVMDQLMDANQGLKRRFSEKLVFQNFAEEDCWKLLTMKCREKGFELEKNTCNVLTDLMRKLIRAPHWGNGGDIETLAKRLQIYIATQGNNDLNTEIKINEQDLKKVMQEFLAEKTSKGSPSHSKPVPQFQHQRQEDVKRNTSIIMTNKQEIEDDEDFDEDKNNTQQEEGMRDRGVSDEIWRELERAKQKEKEEREEQERKIKAAEELRIKMEYERKELEKQLKEAQELKKAEEIRLKLLAKIKAEEEAREKQRKLMDLYLQQQKAEMELQQKLRATGICPMGFNWIKVANGFRCTGGSHFVSSI